MVLCLLQQGKTSTGSPASHSNRPSPPATNDVEAAFTNQEFSWDELGNRRWMVIQDASLSTTLTYQTEGLNRYNEVRHQVNDGGLQDNLLEVAHDRWGRVTRDRDRLYDWDPEGRLRTVRRADDGTTVATYVYDSEGRRISRTVWTEDGLAANFTLRYVWDGDRVIEEWMVLPGDGPSGLGQLVAEYIWGAPAPNGLMAQRRLAHGPTPSEELSASGLADWPTDMVAGAFTYPILDSRGNLRATVTASGVVRERRSFSATGLPLQVDPDTGSLTSVLLPGIDPEPSASDSGLPLLTGLAWEPDARWHYAWHRWISPFTYGRFTSHSPLTYPVAELNYEWVFNSGWDYVDLDGLQSLPLTAPGGGPVSYNRSVCGGQMTPVLVSPAPFESLQARAIRGNYADSLVLHRAVMEAQYRRDNLVNPRSQVPYEVLQRHWNWVNNSQGPQTSGFSYVPAEPSRFPDGSFPGRGREIPAIRFPEPTTPCPAAPAPNTAPAVRPPGSHFYSTASEAQLRPGMYLSSDANQFRQANRQLNSTFETDPAFARSISLDPRGGVADTAPQGSHGIILQIVPVFFSLSRGSSTNRQVRCRDRCILVVKADEKSGVEVVDENYKNMP